jgi:hypothetical protein
MAHQSLPAAMRTSDHVSIDSRCPTGSGTELLFEAVRVLTAAGRLIRPPLLRTATASLYEARGVWPAS